MSRSEVQQTMENPAQFFSQMRALPHFVNGKTDGFSISQVAPGSVFEQLGLQNGDLLTSIDGQPVTNPMQAMGLIQAVKTASAIDLTVNRGGTPTIGSSRFAIDTRVAPTLSLAPYGSASRNKRRTPERPSRFFATAAFAQNDTNGRLLFVSS